MDFGVAAKPLAGEAVSGDACLVRQIDDDVLLSVIDGLGHGAAAAAAANAAVAVIESHLHQPLVELARYCHRGLVQKRGVAMTLVSIQSAGNVLHWLGIGNVWGGVFLASAQPKPHWRVLPSHGGIVGYRLPPLRPSKVTIAPGDWLIMATDGIRFEFDGDLATNEPPPEIARRILARHATGKDDALVLAGHYRGNGL
jgi:negative regulator of sigma-B (phosphoserine phosphatase)